MTKIVHLYLVSDSTGETVLNVSRAAFAHFENLRIQEYSWSMVRTKGQIDKLSEELKLQPGIVLFTLVNQELKNYLQETCSKLHIFCIPVLDQVVGILSEYLKKEIHDNPGKQHSLDEDYFRRMNAINYTIAHDDGQSFSDLENADIILIGPSRTSKTPTSVYLAYRGYKTANIPFVLGQELPIILDDLKKPLIVGLIINNQRLIEIRKNRLLNIHEMANNTYIDEELVHQELLEARRIYKKKSWEIMDVSRKSVEETAANIIALYRDKK